MPPSNPFMGYKAQLGVGAVAPVTTGLEFISETLTKKKAISQWDGIRGHRGRDSEVNVNGLVDVSGNIVIAPTFTGLGVLLPWILGGTTALNVTPLADTLQAFVATIDRGADVFTYTGLKVDKAIFKSQKGNAPLTLELQLVGIDSTTGAAGSFPALTIPLEQPFMHYNGVFTFNAIARNVEDVTITIDNHLDRDQYRNSETRQVIPEMDRTVTIEANTPWTADESDLLTLALGGGVGATIVYTDVSGKVLTFTFATLQLPQEDPSVQSRGAQVGLKTTFLARRLAGADEVKIGLA